MELFLVIGPWSLLNPTALSQLLGSIVSDISLLRSPSSWAFFPFSREEYLKRLLELRVLS